MIRKAHLYIPFWYLFTVYVMKKQNVLLPLVAYISNQIRLGKPRSICRPACINQISYGTVPEGDTECVEICSTVEDFLFLGLLAGIAAAKLGKVIMVLHKINTNGCNFLTVATLLKYFIG